MSGRHRRGGPTDRGKGRENSGAARYWVHWDEPDEADVHLQCFTATEKDALVKQLKDRGIIAEVEVRF